MVAAVGGLIVGALGITSTVGALAVNLALYAGVSAVGYLLQKSQQQDQRDPGIRQKVAFGESVPQSIIVGKYATAGSFLYGGTWGESGKTPNAFLVQVYCLSDMPCDGVLDNQWVNGRKVTVDWTDTALSRGSPVTTFRKSGVDRMWMKFLSGTQTTADSYLTSKFGTATRPWSTDMIGRGRAIMIVTTLYDPEEFDGFPTYLFAVRGAKFYNPKLDSTNGGTGSHRYGTYSTHEYSDNPKVITYNIIRGIYYEGDWVYGGLGYDKWRLDNDTWFSAITTCEENVELNAGGTEDRFIVGGELRLNEPALDQVERIDISCSGRTFESGGIYKTYCGAYGAAVKSFTDDDIIISEESSWEYVPDYTQWVNSVVASYTNINDMWQTRTLAAKTRASYVTADGGITLSQSLGLPMVTSATQAQRLAKAALEEARRFRKHVIYLPPEALGLEPGDIVSWTSTRFPYTSKDFLVGETAGLVNGWIKFTISEVDSADFDWDKTTDEDTDEDSVFDDIVPDSQLLTFTATAVSIKNNAGTARKPGIKLAWSYDEELADVWAIKYQVRDKDTLQVVDRNRVDDVTDEEHIISTGLVRGQDYQVRTRLITSFNRPTSWSSWQNVTVADVGDPAVVDDGSITTDKLSSSPAAVTTEKVRKNTITAWKRMSKSKSDAFTNGSDSSWQEVSICSTVIDNPNPSVVDLQISYFIMVKAQTGQTKRQGSMAGRLVLKRGTKVLWEREIIAILQDNSGTAIKTIKPFDDTFRLYDYNAPSGESTYSFKFYYKRSRTLDATSSTERFFYTASASMVATWDKR